MSGRVVPSIVCGAGSGARPVGDLGKGKGIVPASEARGGVGPALSYVPPAADWDEAGWFTDPDADRDVPAVEPTVTPKGRRKS